ncbi:bile acid-CoA:amino acid N-acyltransferase-like [Rhinoraja longicauda]
MKYFWMRRLVRSIFSGNFYKMKPSIGRSLTSGRAMNTRPSVAPIIKNEPTRGLVDEPVKLEIGHLVPDQRVTLHSQLLSEDDDRWMAYAHYISDSEGIVPVIHDNSLGGTYTGQEPLGLIWSMKLAPDNRQEMRYRKKDMTTPLTVTVSVHDGWISSNFDMDVVLASVVLECFYMAPGTARLEFREGRVVGTLFFPPGPGPFPAILDMWGGGGGLFEYRAALLASRGYAVLALAFTGHKDIPQSKEVFDLKFSYFEEAFDALNNHPKVAKGRVALLGISLGFTIAFTIASEVPNIQPKCLIGINGTHLNNVHGGKADLIEDEEDLRRKVKFTEDGAMIWKHISFPITNYSKPIVQVDKIRCRFMIICGEDDQNCPVAESADELRKMMKAAGNNHLLTTISYPQTGHLIEPPYSPHFRISKLKINSLNKTVRVLWGGTTKPHADAQEDSWKKILAFLERHLIQEHPAVIQSNP